MSHAAEIAVVGSCLVDDRAMRKAVENVRPEFFTDSALAVMFTAMRRMFLDGVPVDVVTLKAHMTADEREKCHFDSTMAMCAEKVPTALHVEHYGRIVRNTFFKKKLMVVLDEAKKNPADVKMRAQILECWEELDGVGCHVMDMKEGMHEYVDFVEQRASGKAHYMRTGFQQFDNVTGGITRGDMVTFGARTSRGKTSAMLSLATRYLDAGLKVLFVTGEMTPFQIIDRTMAIRSGVSLTKLRRPLINRDQTVFMDGVAAMSELPFFVADVVNMNLAKMNELARTVRPDVMFIDYINLFPSPPKDNNRASFLTSVAYGLKALAKDKNLAVIVACQFNRAIEWAKEREPVLADLKESGGIEEASDICVLMHFPEQAVEMYRHGVFIIAKHRNGPLGRVPFNFYEPTTAFNEIDLSDPAAGCTPAKAEPGAPIADKTPRNNEQERKDLF